MLDISKLRLTQPSLAGSGAELGNNILHVDTVSTNKLLCVNTVSINKILCVDTVSTNKAKL